MHLLGGAFGDGVIARIVRGYTFISRYYRNGDHIHIIGFSRGAYTARALAGLIVSQGLLAPPLTADKEQAYKHGIQAWYQYRQHTVSGFFRDILDHLEALCTELPEGILGNGLGAKDLIPVPRLATVGVWDTVGAMGIPLYWCSDKRIDAFKFDNLELSPKIDHGYHAVSLDERRDDFRPTLWKPDTHVTQRLFPGAHCDVGGGYPTVDNESGLSDGALDWMMLMLGGNGSEGLLFSDEPEYIPKPDPTGTSHAPWKHSPWTLPGILLNARQFPDHVLSVDDSITKC